MNSKQEEASEEAIDVPGESQRERDTQQPKAGRKDSRPTRRKDCMGRTGERAAAALVIRHATGEPKAGDMPELYLVVQNVSDAPIRFSDTVAAPELRMLYIKLDGKIQAGIGTKDPTGTDVMLQPREVAFLLMYSPDSKGSDGRTTGALMAESALRRHASDLGCGDENRTGAGRSMDRQARHRRDERSSGGGRATAERHRGSRSFSRVWLASARTDGKIPGGALGSLAGAVSNFIKLNPTDERVPKLTELLKRIDTSRDWTQADAVALLDDAMAIYAGLADMSQREVRFSTEVPSSPASRCPPGLTDAAWGQRAANGLRAAWQLEPGAGPVSAGHESQGAHSFPQHRQGDGRVPDAGLASIRDSPSSATRTVRASTSPPLIGRL